MNFEILDERTKNMEKQTQNLSDKISLLDEKLDIKFTDLMENISNNYVNKLEFDPVKKLVYGTTGAVLSGFIMAVLYFITWGKG